MARAGIIALAGALLACGVAARGQAVRAPSRPAAESPRAQIGVDPRVELLAVLFRLSGADEYTRGAVEPYAQAVDEYFANFRDHEAVRLAREMRSRHGVSYDAPMSLAVHLTDPPALAERVPFDAPPPGLDTRWPLEQTRAFLAAARRFAEESDFQAFLDAHRDLYAESTRRLEVMLAEQAHLGWFEAFFGQRAGAQFRLVVAPLNGGHCYGVRLDGSGAGELYCVLGVWKADAEGVPVFEAEVAPAIVHEYCHSYVNPLVERHRAELRKPGQALFAPVADAMRQQAYTTWDILLCEYLVRACVNRYLQEHGTPLAVAADARENRRRGFHWIRDLTALLGEYEADRTRYPTLEAFAPRLVTFFTEQAAEAEQPTR